MKSFAWILSVFVLLGVFLGAFTSATSNYCRSETFEQISAENSSPELDHKITRFFAGLRGGAALISPTGLQTFVRDREQTRFSLGGSLYGGAWISDFYFGAVSLGREQFSRDTTDRAPYGDRGFIGSYSVVGHPVLLYLGRRITDFQLGLKDRISVRGALGPGASVLTQITAENDFNERLTSERTTLWGAAARIEATYERASIPAAVALGIGYRYFQDASLGWGPTVVTIGGLSVDVGIEGHF